MLAIVTLTYCKDGKPHKCNMCHIREIAQCMAVVTTEKLTLPFSEVIAQPPIQTAAGEECIHIYNSSLKVKLRQ